MTTASLQDLCLPRLCAEPRIERMTVGIGVLCEGGKAAVIAADRLLTVGAIVHEGDTRKLIKLSDTVCVTCTGNMHEVRIVLDAVDRRGVLLDAAVERIQTGRSALRRSQLDELIRRRIGVGIDEFASKAGATPSAIYNSLYTDISQFKLSLEFLIVGVDGKAAKIIRVDDSTEPVGHDAVGFAAIGSGGNLAYGALAAAEHTKIYSVTESLLSVTGAKVAAEMNPNVGRTTDIAIVGVGRKAQFLPSRAIKRLRQIYDGMHRRRKLDVKTRRQIDELVPENFK